MYKNYFFLNRFITEAKEELKNFSLQKVFTQEKDRLIFEFIKNDEEKFLEISVNPGFPFISFKRTFHRAKKNTIEFFSSYLPSEFISFEIAERDRIARLKLNSSSLYFAIRGKFTNLYLISDREESEAFKKVSDQQLQTFSNEASSLNFTSHFNIPVIELTTNSFREEIKKKYPVIGNEIISETEFRSGDLSYGEKIKTLIGILNEIKNEKTALFINGNESQIRLAVRSFSIFPSTEIREFDRLLSAMDYFISKKFSLEFYESKEKIVRKHIDRELKKLSNKLNNLKARIDSGSKEDEYNKTGNLLLINLGSIYKGMESIKIRDIYSNDSEIEIKLDKTLSPQKNVDKYFDKAKSERINFKKSKLLFQDVKKEFERFKFFEQKLDSLKTPEDFKSIMKELKIKEAAQSPEKEDLKEKFKHYVIDDKYNIFVGRDSQNNDLLTTRFAKQNDYWFHARSVSGSHVVLRVENTKEAVPKDILKKTASLAAYHSKAKTSGMVPVSFTQKKYVVKKKGMEPGKVALLKEDVLIVKPEIPSGCEYIQ